MLKARSYNTLIVTINKHTKKMCSKDKKMKFQAEKFRYIPNEKERTEKIRNGKCLE